MWPFGDDEEEKKPEAAAAPAPSPAAGPVAYPSPYLAPQRFEEGPGPDATAEDIMTGGLARSQAAVDKMYKTRQITSNYSRDVVTAEEKAAHAKAQQAELAQADLLRQAGDVKVQNAQNEAALAAEKTAALTERQAKYNAFLDEQQAKIDGLAARSAAEREKFRGMDYRDFWADKTNAQKIMAGLGVALGAWASKGGQNQAMTMLNDAIKRDMDLQRAKMDKQEKNVAYAAADLREAKELKTERFAELQLKEAAAWEITAQKYAEKKAALGVPLEQIQKDVTYQQMIQKAAAADEEWLKGQRAKINTTTQRMVYENLSTAEKAAVGAGAVGKATEAAKRNKALVDSARPQMEQIQLLQPKVTDKGLEEIRNANLWTKVQAEYRLPTALGAEWNAFVPKLLQSDAFRTPGERLMKYSGKDKEGVKATYELYRNYVSAFDKLNTLITGAGQTESEWGRRVETLAPGPGDLEPNSEGKPILYDKIRDMKALWTAFGKYATDNPAEFLASNRRSNAQVIDPARAQYDAGTGIYAGLAGRPGGAPAPQAQAAAPAALPPGLPPGAQRNRITGQIIVPAGNGEWMEWNGGS